MANGRFVTYLRVSTAKQGQSGLGLEAQRAAVTGYLNGGEWTLVREIVEVESGKKSDRPALAQALRLCRQQKATLLIAKLDRLARNVHFISGLMESGVEFVAVDMPKANNFTVHIMAAVAEQEAEAISKRTIAALAAAKARGTKLGGRRVSAERLTEIRGQAREANTAKAQKTASALLPIIREIQAGGANTLRAIAAELNERAIETPRTKRAPRQKRDDNAHGGFWSPVQVQRILAQFGTPSSPRRKGQSVADPEPTHAAA